MSDDGCGVRKLVSFDAVSEDSHTIALSLDPLAGTSELTCGRRVELSDQRLRANRAEMFSVGTMERGGVRCRAFIGATSFESPSHEVIAQARFRLSVPSALVAQLEERYEVSRASLIAVVARRGTDCGYDALLRYPDGEYRATFDGPCGLDLAGIEDAAADMHPVRTTLDFWQFGPGRGHALGDVGRASATLAASANDRPSECAVIFGFSVSFLPDDDDVAADERSVPVEALRISRCDGPLTAIGRAIAAAVSFNPEE